MLFKNRSNTKTKLQLLADLIRVFIKKRRGYVVVKKQMPFSVLCAYCLVETISRLKKVCVCDLKHLVTKINKHEGSKKHKNNFVSFQLLGKTNIVTCLSTVYAEEIRKHNEKVTKNRDILAKIIDILRPCSMCVHVHVSMFSVLFVFLCDVQTA
jgi:hypothetical protein